MFFDDHTAFCVFKPLRSVAQRPSETSLGTHTLWHPARPTAPLRADSPVSCLHYALSLIRRLRRPLDSVPRAVPVAAPCTTGTEVLAQLFNGRFRRSSDVRFFEAGRRRCVERNRTPSVARGGHPSGFRGAAETNRSSTAGGADGAPNAASLGAVRRGGVAGHELPASTKAAVLAELREH